MAIEIERSLSIKQFGKRYQIGPRKVRELIRRGILAAVDIGKGAGRQQFRIPPEAIRTFEAGIAVKPASPFRRRRCDDGISPTVRALLADD
jgi:hypothetical protein